MTKDVVGFEGLYYVDENGNVYSYDKVVQHNYGGKAIKKGKQLKPEKTNCGYLRVLLINKDNKRCHVSIHRAVAEAFISNPNNLPQVNHIDGNKLNNNVNNLEWVTSSQNINHAFKNGLNHGKTKGIKCMVDGIVFESIQAAANYYNTSHYKISKIIERV